MNKTPQEILKEATKTFAKNQPIYGDNWKQIGKVMAMLFPDGLHLDDAESYNRFHLWFMILVKLTRLAQNDFDHKDSAHDIVVYGAMLESMSSETVIGYSAKFNVIDSASDVIKEVNEHIDNALGIVPRDTVTTSKLYKGTQEQINNVLGLETITFSKEHQVTPPRKCTYAGRDYWLDKGGKLYHVSLCDEFGKPFAGHILRHDYYLKGEDLYSSASNDTIGVKSDLEFDDE